jgi:glycosyltransferase involved in cell wall biosynthesis
MLQIPVSVIVPCFNVKEFIHEGIKSITSQTYTNFEIVCLDDYSNDGTYEILIELAKKDERIKVYRNESNIGLIGTLNRLVELSNYDVLIRMDPDDISLSDRFEKLLSGYLKTGVCIASSNYNLIDTTGKKLKKRGLSLLKTPAGIIFTSLFNSPIPHAPCLIKKEIFQQNKFDTNFKAAEDYKLWSLLIRNDINVLILEEPLYLYRQNPFGMSLSNNVIQATNHVLIAKENIKYFLNYTLSSFNFLDLNKQLIDIELNIKQSKELIVELIELHRLFCNKNNLTVIEQKEINIYFAQYLFFTYFNLIRNQKHTLTRFKVLNLVIINAIENFNFFTNNKFLIWALKTL